MDERRDVERPGTAADVIQIVRRFSWPDSVVVSLALASTSAWETPLPPVVDGRVYCVYFEPSQDAGWKLVDRVTSDADEWTRWFCSVAHPQGAQALTDRARMWFSRVGQAIAKRAKVLDVDEIAAGAEVPVWTVESFLGLLQQDDPMNWAYQPERRRLLYLGP
jgi:hypothetical protein